METNILDVIEGRLGSMPVVQRKIADFVIKDPLTVSFLSTNELAERIGVSPASIVRFAQQITSGGFPQLQSELQAYIQSTPDPLKRLELNVITGSENDAVLARVFETQMDNLRRSFNKQLITAVNKAATLISEAEHIYTTGSRGSYSIAYYLGHHLNRVLNNTDIIQSGDRLADFMARPTERDLAIIVCLPRYNDRLLNAARVLHEKGAKLVVITDSVRSPFVPYSDAAFFAFYNSNDFHNSLISPMLFSEMLLSLVISKNLARAKNNLDQIEAMFTSLNQFLAGD